MLTELLKSAIVASGLVFRQDLIYRADDCVGANKGWDWQGNWL